MALSWMQTVLVAIVIFLCFWKNLIARFRGLPPGPLELPIVGSIPHLTKNAHLKLAKMGKKYGGVFTIHLGMMPTVIVTDGNLIREVLIKNGNNFIGRPDLFNLKIVGGGSGIALSYTPYWKTMKAFTKKMLSSFGYNKSEIEPSVLDEAQKIYEEFLQLDSQVIDLKHRFFAHILNMTWNTVTGKRFSPDDPKSIQLNDDMLTSFKLLNPNSPALFFPILRFLFPNSFHIKEGIAASKNFDDTIREEINQISANYDSGEALNFIEAYWREINGRREEERIGTHFNVKNLVYIVKELMFGGTETSDTTIKWGLYYLTQYPTVQKKMQAELDEVIGMNRFPAYSDRNKLPYTSATILEITRFASILPFSLPHQCIESTTLGGYKIPAGMPVYVNMWAMHHDPDIWGDPEIFRPERFLNKDGKVKESDYLLPFGAGPRVCLGEFLGKLMVFIFLTTVVQRFEFQFRQTTKNVKACECLTLMPPPFEVYIQKRFPEQHV